MRSQSRLVKQMARDLNVIQNRVCPPVREADDGAILTNVI